jgi:DMSO/TMAO reductase YedYZ molybdopterin-dependent catalytic subunit
MINGLVEKPMVFTMEDLKRFPRENRVYFLECAANSGMEWRGAQLNGCQFTHGMIHNVMYTGVPLKLMLEEAGLKTNAKWLMPEGADASGMTARSDEKALDDCLIAFKMNGEALRPEQGYPLRLVVPGWEGNMWVKWIRRIEVGDEPWHHREETSKYTDLLENGKARRASPGRWTQVGHHQSRARRRRSSTQGPDGDHRRRLVGPRHDQARRRHLDGGKNWRQARIDGPSLEKSMHRFYYEFDWDGSPLLLQSRAHRQRPATSSRPRTSCARCAAPTRSTTTTASRPGTSGATERLKMSKFLKGLAARAAVLRGRAMPQPRGSEEVRPWPRRHARPRSRPGTSMCVPDGQGLPVGQGNVSDGEDDLRRATAPSAMATSARASTAGRCSPAGRIRLKTMSGRSRRSGPTGPICRRSSTTSTAPCPSATRNR